MNQLAIGADIGGTHITCQVFDLIKNEPATDDFIRIAVDSAGSKDEIIDSWVSAIKSAAAPFGFDNISGIGFGMPGPFDYPNGIAWFEGVAKFESLYGVNVKSELIKKLRLPADLPVRFLNDASCFAIGEAFRGEATLAERVLAITLGTGFGTTFTIDKIPVAGVYGIPEDGFLYRVSFGKSVADEYFSTRWFINEYHGQTCRDIAGVKQLAEIAGSDEVASKLFRLFGDNLGNFLLEWIRQVGLQAIVIGGSISKSYSLFEDSLESIIKNNNCKIYLANPSATNTLLGCAKLCDDEFYNRLINSKKV